jgi:TP901 family phage tail tape measure protein
MASYNVADLYAKFGVKTDGGSFKNAMQAISGIRDGLALLGEVARKVTETLKSFTTDVFDQADEMSKLSQKTGVNIETLQELGYAAGLADVPMEGLAGSLKFLQRNMVNAIEGNKELQDAFKTLKVHLVDSHGQVRKTEDVFSDLADAFAKMPDTAARSAYAMKVFGKQGAEMIPLLMGGSKAIREQAGEYRELHGVMTEDFGKRSEELNDNMRRIKTAFDGVKLTVAEALLPVFEDMIGTTLTWVKANQELIRSKVKEYVERAAAAISEFVKQVRDWINAHGGLEAVLKSTGEYLRAFGIILAGIKIAEVITSISNLISILKTLGTLVATGLGVAGLVGLMIWAASAIVDNWDDIAEFFEYLWDRVSQGFVKAAVWIKDEFLALVQWVADKLQWVADKAAAVADKLNPFSINDTSTSGVRGVPMSNPLLDAAVAMSHDPALGVTSPSLVERGNGSAVSVVNSPQFNITQLPGEDGDKFAKRVAAINQEEAQRTFREAQGGIL